MPISLCICTPFIITVALTLMFSFCFTIAWFWFGLPMRLHLSKRKSCLYFKFLYTGARNPDFVGKSININAVVSNNETNKNPDFGHLWFSSLELVTASPCDPMPTRTLVVLLRGRPWLNKNSSCITKSTSWTPGAGSILRCASMRLGCHVPADWRWFIKVPHQHGKSRYRLWNRQ